MLLRICLKFRLFSLFMCYQIHVVYVRISLATVEVKPSRKLAYVEILKMHRPTCYQSLASHKSPTKESVKINVQNC